MNQDMTIDLLKGVFEKAGLEDLAKKVNKTNFYKLAKDALALSASKILGNHKEEKAFDRLGRQLRMLDVVEKQDVDDAKKKAMNFTVIKNEWSVEADDDMKAMKPIFKCKKGYDVSKGKCIEEVIELKRLARELKEIFS